MTSLQPLKRLRSWAKKNISYSLKIALAPYFPILKNSIYTDVRRLPGDEFPRQWIDPTSKDYQRQLAENRHLEEMPTIDEIKAAINAHLPRRVLEIGCRSGQVLRELSTDLMVEGCDVCVKKLRQCPPDLRVFQYDLGQQTGEFERDNLYRWDVVLLLGVMQSLTKSPLQTAYAVNNLLMLANRKVIVWDWPVVCFWMQQFSDSQKFEYHPLKLRVDK